jgi:FixJ family two-component response regulator
MIRMSKASTVVVIDDDANVREATGCLLRAVGYSSVTYGSAEEFLASAHLHDASCVISDIRMPGLDGFALQARLAADRYDLPLILVTAFAENGSRERAMAAGAHGFLTKPYLDEDLLERVASAVRRPHR